MTLLLEDTRTETIAHTATSDGDHDRFAHYVAAADLTAMWFEGTPVTALCGKTDRLDRDVKKYPVCPTCKEIYEQMED
ncbi:DUF3039 domain-containing protein [Herbiconiux sp. YIM B11900]|uniref:DUF3039 domain-containing protein n=1 Tax=Herbiconiux sp. YIM B11900 TaxID=3404131 RepID=UPI003F84F871